MNKIFKLIVLIYFFIFSVNLALSAENFFEEALKMYQDKEYDDARFMLERNIVFNPKDAKSYLYLAKIFKSEENEKEHIKNIRTTLLLEPDNEEAMYMLINYEIKKSNYSQVKELKESFLTICKSLCDKKGEIEESLKDIEVE